MQVRPAQADDAALLVRHALALAQESEGRTLDPATVQAGVARALANPGRARYFVAEDGSGSLFVTPEWSDWNASWYWWVQGLYVEPPRRRQGVHRALHEAVLAAARQAGVAEVRLYVHRDNPARTAYRRLGMEELPYRIYAQTTRRATAP